MNGSTSSKDNRVKDDGYIYMVLEYGEIDLAHMLSQKWKEIERSNSTMDQNWLRFYWQVNGIILSSSKPTGIASLCRMNFNVLLSLFVVFALNVSLKVICET